MQSVSQSRQVWQALACMLLGICCLGANADEPMDIGSRLELFVDDYLLDQIHGARRVLHNPVPREVVLERNKPWEGNVSGYTTVFLDGDTYRMYYRGTDTVYTEGEVTSPHRAVVCYAESTDGIHWERPELGLVEFEGSKANNNIWDGVGHHNFTPFMDKNSDCPPEAKYKALGSGGGEHGLYAFQSSDGIHWELMHDDPVITKGAFDSQNLAFWDTVRGEYRAYVRDFRDGRDIRTCTSDDFLEWTEPEFVSYSPGRIGQLYTNGVIPYYRAPHIYLGFPTRYVDYAWAESTNNLPQREYRELVASSSRRSGTAFSDGMFMSSRDGECFAIWPEAFIRPGIQRPGSWFYGDNYQNWGIVATPSQFKGAPNELSFYLTEYARQREGNNLRRFTLRVDGFVSIQAPLAGGEVVTKPVVFEGDRLEINLSTSAGGSVKVELQYALGNPIEGFTLEDATLLYGDELARVVSWEDGHDVSSLEGKPVRLRFVLKDADVYSFRFREASEAE